MHDLLGLEYINTIMCLKPEKLKIFPCDIPSSFSLSSPKKQDVSPPQSVVWKEVRVFMCACVRIKEEKKEDMRGLLIALFKCHFTAG